MAGNLTTPDDWRVHLIDDDASLRRVLTNTRRIAVLGIKMETYQPAYYVFPARRLRDRSRPGVLPRRAGNPWASGVPARQRRARRRRSRERLPPQQGRAR